MREAAEDTIEVILEGAVSPRTDRPKISARITPENKTRLPG